MDHIQLLSRGGHKYDPANCRASCSACNLGRGDREPVPQPEHRALPWW
ncbi:HNH endonuclease [Actinoplanes awajinensis]